MYRTDDRPRPMPTGRADDVSTPTIITVNDGATTRLAFPCFYAYRKDGMPIPFHHMSPMEQNHYGWPQPTKPDRSSQPQLIESLVVEPIHLKDEGYIEANFAMNIDEDNGVVANAEIDDNVIRVFIDCNVGWGMTKPMDVPFALFVNTDLDDESAEYTSRDVVTTGILRVLPPFGNIETGE